MPERWLPFLTEIGLVALTIGVFAFDAFARIGSRRAETLNGVALAGVAALLGSLAFQWGRFGTAFGGSYVQDGVSYFFKLIFLVSAFFVLFMARNYLGKLRRGHAEFTLLILFALVGMTFLASANDFLVFFVALETLTVSMYVMVAYLKDRDESIEAGVKYLVLGALSTAVFLYGLSFVYGSTGSTSFAAIRDRAAAGPTLPFLFGTVLILASLGFKISAVPFQAWAPDVYQGAPTPVTAYLATASKAAGFAALVRFSLTVFAPVQDQLTGLFAILAAATIIYGNIGAIRQTNLKRLLGYSSIGHAGYLLIGLAAFTHSGAEAILFYLLGYVFSTAGAFLVLVALAAHLKTDDISELAGLSRRSPLLAAGLMFSLFSLAGVPPLVGFFAKFYILWAGMKAGLLWLVVIGVLNVVTSLYYYLKIVRAAYIDRPAETPVELTLSHSQKAMQYVSLAGIFALGIFQGPFVRLAERAIVSFLS